MAEATVETASVRYFCHQCNREISPQLPDYTCPHCEGGFIEQLSQDNGTDADDEDIGTDLDPAAQFAELWRQTFSVAVPEDEPQESRRRRQPRPRIAMRARRRSGQNNPPTNAATMAAIDMIFQNLLGGLGATVVVRGEDEGSPTMGFPFNFLHLHGNPRDYAWGSEGLDAIITQLLNQMEGAGPLPAEDERIESLPKVTVTQGLVDAQTECAVCQEKLQLGEEVRKLPCNHIYHEPCIVPWLKMHDSCPVCRLSLTKDSTRGSSTEDGPSETS